MSSWIAALTAWLAIVVAGVLEPALVFTGTTGVAVAVLGVLILCGTVRALRR
jgi:hypothetical protein